MFMLGVCGQVARTSQSRNLRRTSSNALCKKQNTKKKRHAHVVGEAEGQALQALGGLAARSREVVERADLCGGSGRHRAPQPAVEAARHRERRAELRRALEAAVGGVDAGGPDAMQRLAAVVVLDHPELRDRRPDTCHLAQHLRHIEPREQVGDALRDRQRRVAEGLGAERRVLAREPRGAREQREQREPERHRRRSDARQKRRSRGAPGAPHSSTLCASQGAAVNHSTPDKSCPEECPEQVPKRLGNPASSPAFTASSS